jgi:hypothetical protein
MDAKRLIHRKQKNGLIPLSDETLIDKSPSNVLVDVLNLGINLHGLNTASIKLQSAITKIQDRKRLQEYISDIARKWEIDANAVSNEIQFVIMLVLFPMLQDRYNSHTEARETKRELADIKTLINKIEDGSIKTFKITLKATNVKGIPEDISIKSSMVIRSIYEHLKSFPDVEIKTKTKGRPKGTPALENVQMKYCAELLKKGYSSKLDINVYEFIGDIFEATGLYYDEAEFIDKLIEKQLKYESLKDYKVSSVKALLRR